jgi:hypothetical protein
MTYTLLNGAFVALLVLVSIYGRRRLLAKTQNWVPIVGVVKNKSSRLIGETPDQLVDVEYVYGGVIVRARNVETDGLNTTDYPMGCHIRLIVDPNKPEKCMLEARIRPEYSRGWVWQAKKPWF